MKAPKMIRRRTSAQVLAAVMAAALVLSGCSSSSGTADDTADSAEEEAVTAEEETDTTQETAEETEENETEEESGTITESDYIDVINIALSNDLSDLSPWGTNTSGARGYTVASIYETLLTLDEDGEFIPCLAESYEMINSYTYDFYLYDYIYDTEGNHLTASDVVFSVETCLELGSNPAVCDKLTGAEELDEYTVRLYMVEDAGVGDIENVIGNFFIVTQAAWEASEDAMVRTPVGTSHYVVTEFTPSSSLTVVDTQNYWQTEELTAPRSRANVETINYYIITESAQRAIALQNGTVDYAIIASTDLDQFSDESEYTITQIENSGGMCLIPNCSDDSPLADENVRKAVFYAIDNSGVAAGFTTNIAEPVNGIGSAYYSDYYTDVFDSLAADNYYSYDIEKAQEYLSAAGYSAGELTLTLMVQSTQAMQDVAAILQGYLSIIGINVEIVTYDNSVIETYLEDSTNWDLYATSYRGDVSWVNVTEKFINEEKFTTGGTMNFIMDDDLQEMLQTVRSVEGHTEENVIAYHEYLIDNAYVMGLIIQMTSNVTDSKFSGGFVYQDTNNSALCVGACTYTAE